MGCWASCRFSKGRAQPLLPPGRLVETGVEWWHPCPHSSPVGLGQSLRSVEAIWAWVGKEFTDTALQKGVSWSRTEIKWALQGSALPNRGQFWRRASSPSVLFRKRAFGSCSLTQKPPISQEKWCSPTRRGRHTTREQATESSHQSRCEHSQFVRVVGHLAVPCVRISVWMCLRLFYFLYPTQPET